MVKPKCSNKVLAGADSPNVSMPNTLSLLFRILYQELGCDNSITSEGRSSLITDDCYSLFCCKNLSRHGIETILDMMPCSFFKLDAASIANCSSLPVAIKVMFALS